MIGAFTRIVSILVQEQGYINELIMCQSKNDSESGIYNLTSSNSEIANYNSSAVIYILSS